MIKRIKESAVILLAYIAFLPVAARAQTTPTYGPLQTTGDLMAVVNTGINLFIGLAGVLSVIFIILGGFQYITSGTSKDGTTKAKNTITYAIIGLIIVALSVVIRNFVLSKFGTGVSGSQLDQGLQLK